MDILRQSTQFSHPLQLIHSVHNRWNDVLYFVWSSGWLSLCQSRECKWPGPQWLCGTTHNEPSLWWRLSQKCLHCSGGSWCGIVHLFFPGWLDNLNVLTQKMSELFGGLRVVTWVFLCSQKILGIILVSQWGLNVRDQIRFTPHN